MIEVLLGKQLVLEEFLTAFEIVSGLIQLGDRLRQVRLGGIERGLGREHIGVLRRQIGLGGRDGRLLGLHAGRLLDVLRPHQQLALGDVVAFLDQDFGDLSDGVGVDVGLILLHGFDLTVGGNNLGQILRAGLCRFGPSPRPAGSTLLPQWPG